MCHGHRQTKLPSGCPAMHAARSRRILIGTQEIRHGNLSGYLRDVAAGLVDRSSALRPRIPPNLLPHINHVFSHTPYLRTTDESPTLSEKSFRSVPGVPVRADVLPGHSHHDRRGFLAGVLRSPTLVNVPTPPTGMRRAHGYRE